ncbi:MAG: hypothetical protein JO283_06270 [Bradyrhizobium sp.]|nr:hypothetical protein [Bradyrhizobium sp.]
MEEIKRQIAAAEKQAMKIMRLAELMPPENLDKTVIEQLAAFRKKWEETAEMLEAIVARQRSPSAATTTFIIGELPAGDYILGDPKIIPTVRPCKHS